MKKILVVEDDPDVLKVVIFRLEKAGYDTVTAKDGQVALDLIQELKPDLVLLDLILPVIDGYTLCRQVKTDEKLKHIPIILFTGIMPASLPRKVRELKADDYLIKPFNVGELLNKVRRFIG